MRFTQFVFVFRVTLSSQPVIFELRAKLSLRSSTYFFRLDSLSSKYFSSFPNRETGRDPTFSNDHPPIAHVLGGVVRARPGAGGVNRVLRRVPPVPVGAVRPVRAVRVPRARPRVNGHAVDGGKAVAAAGVADAVNAADDAAVGAVGAVVGGGAGAEAVGGVHGDQGGRDGLDAAQ